MDLELLYQRKPSSLIRAVHDGDLQRLKDILESGEVHPNSADHRGMTALHEAAARNQYAIVEALLSDERTNPEAITHEGLTALTLAVKNDACLKLVKLLDRHVKDKCYPLLLLDACMDASPETVEYIMSHSEVIVNEESPTFQTTPLLAALDGGKLRVVELILDAGADVNFMHDSYGMPLSYAISEGCNKSIIDLLISRGASVDHPSLSPLRLALEAERNDVVGALLDSIKVRHDEITALTAAVQYKAAHLVRGMLSEASSEALENKWKQEEGHVGLLCAAIHSENDNILSMILNHNFSKAVLEAPITVRFSHGVLKLRYVFMGPLAFLLKEKMYRSTTISTLKKLISMGISIEPKMSAYFPPLVGLLYSKASETSFSKAFGKALKILLSSGVNVDHKTTFLPDAIVASIALNNFEVFSMLLPYSRYTPCDIAQVGLDECIDVYYFILEHMATSDDYTSLGKPDDVAVDGKIVFSNVPSLAAIARHRVRRYLRNTNNSTEFVEAINSLDIPQFLKDYLRYM